MKTPSKKVVRLPADGREWCIRVKTLQPELAYLEANPAGDDPNDPAEVLAITRSSSRNGSVETACDFVLQTMAQRTGAGQFALHTRSRLADGELIHWSISDDLIDLDCAEIQRIFDDGEFRFNVVYTRRGGHLADDAAAEWMERIATLPTETGDFDQSSFRRVPFGGARETAALRKLVAKAGEAEKNAKAYFDALQRALSAAFYHDDPITWAVGKLLLAQIASNLGAYTPTDGEKEARAVAIHDAKRAASLLRTLQQPDVFRSALTTLCDLLAFAETKSRVLDLTNCASGYGLLAEESDAAEVSSLPGLVARWLCALLSLAALRNNDGDERSLADQLIRSIKTYPAEVTPEVLNYINWYGAQCLRRGEATAMTYFREAVEIFDAMEELVKTVALPAGSSRMDFFPQATGGQRAALLGLAGVEAALAAPAVTSEFGGLMTAVYLRPLETSRRVLMQNRFSRYDRRDLEEKRWTATAGMLSLEAALHCNLSGWLTTISVAGATEGIGMGRAQVFPQDWLNDNEPRSLEDDFRARDDAGEEVWKGVVSVLFETAALFFLLASPSEGVAWEVRQLRDRNLLERTGFIMVPNALEAGAGEVWEACRKRYRAFGLQLPPYSEEGAFVFFSNKRTRPRMLPFEAVWDGALNAYIQEILLRELQRQLENAGEPLDVAQLLMRISVVYRANGRLEEALSFRERAVEHYRELGDRRAYAMALANLAYLHQVMGAQELALEKYEESRALFRQEDERDDEYPLRVIGERVRTLRS